MSAGRLKSRAWFLFVPLVAVGLVVFLRSGGVIADGSGVPSLAGRSIDLFAGSASRPPTEEAARLFEEETGAEVVLHFGGSGKMLSEIKLARRGDLYFPGSSDYMELAKQERLVVPATERVVAYLLPAIIVPKGNPQGIKNLADLGRAGLRVAMARPDSVCVGLYAAEILDRAGLSARVRSNIVTQAESCEKLAEVVSLGLADAALGWRIFQYWDSDRLEAVFLEPGQIGRIGYIPIALLTFSRDPDLSRRFIEFLTSARATAIFEKRHYLTTLAEARRWGGRHTAAGGRWQLPEEWKR